MGEQNFGHFSDGICMHSFWELVYIILGGALTYQTLTNSKPKSDYDYQRYVDFYKEFGGKIK